MNEAVAILIFVLIMIITGIKNVRKIQVKAKTNYIRRTMSVVISVAAIVLFWSKTLSFKIELIALILLLLFCGFAPEGLGKNQVIKLGSLNSNLKHYPKIELESEDNSSGFTRIYFITGNSKSSYLVVQGNIEFVKEYLLKQMLYIGKLVIKN